MSGPRHSRFSPHLVPGDDLERLFVGRGTLVDQLVADLVSAARTGGARYELLVGPRGAGKSHLSALVRHRLTRALGSDAIVIALDEEEHVGSLLGLLARLLRRFPDEPGVPSTADQEQALRGVPRGEAIERAIGLMEARLGTRALVLFVENLDQLFDDIGRDGQQKLRGALQSHLRWSVVATSRTLSLAFTKPQQPFFNTFAPHPLPPLTPAGCRDQLLRLAQIDQKTDLAAFLATQTGLARVAAIHHFTGGNPRAMALVYPYLTREKLDDLVEAFYGLSEELTPYYQEQMARLASGQRPVLEALAENWRPMSPSELSERLYETPATISVQLKRLKDDRLVTSLAVGRERFYEIAEPLHRLARAMKRPDRIGEVLARFLRFWYTEPELDGMLDVAPDHRDVRVHLVGLREAEEAGGAFAEACESAVTAASGAGHHLDAVELARQYFDREPTERSAGWLVRALLMAEDEDGARAVVRETEGRRWILPALSLAEWLDAVTPDLRESVTAALATVSPGSPLRLRALLQLIRLGTEDALDEAVSLFGARPRPRGGAFAHLLRTLFDRGRYAAVLRLVDAAGPSRLSHHGLEAWFMALGAVGRWEEARAFASGSGAASDGVTLTRALGRFGLEMEALSVARTTAERFPTDDDALRSLAAQEYRAGNARAAARVAEPLVRRHPDDTLAWLILGLALRAVDASRAGDAFERAYALAPDAGIRLFEWLLWAGRLDRARTVAGELGGRAWETLARGVIAVLDGAPADAAMQATVFHGEVDTMIGIHCLRLLAIRPGEPLRVAFPDGPPPTWRPLAILLGNSWTEFLSNPDAARALDAIDAFFGLGDEIAVGRAIAALPTTVVPWARLAAEERAIGRSILERAEATELLARLPIEPAA